jgi:hypothetical protein
MNLCEQCVNPLADTKARLCNDCRLLASGSALCGNFEEELTNFLSSRTGNSVVFGLSGGLDSVVTLHKLYRRGWTRKLSVIPVTVDHGFKGSITWTNIRAVLEATDLLANHRVYAISQDAAPAEARSSLAAVLPDGAETAGASVVEFFQCCVKHGIVPCGRLCNQVIDAQYKRILSEFCDDHLVTGGDTPKLNSDHFSILWQKHGYVVVRAAFALGCTKEKNRQYVQRHALRWIDPLYGGNDTDCLLPGGVKRGLLQMKAPADFEGAVRRFPNSVSYFADRVRWSVIERETALSRIEFPEVSSDSAYSEFLAAAAE